MPVPFESDLNPHQLLFIGKLIEPINVRYFNNVKQTFVGNFTGNKELRNPGSVNKEAYWIKEPITAQTILYYDDTSSPFPVHIDGYTAGVMRNFNYFTADDTTRTAQFANEDIYISCLLYTSPSPRDGLLSRMPSSA